VPDILVADFAGWGTAHPDARKAASDALGPDRGTNLKWLDYYLPRRTELGANDLARFAPHR
jgi:hypothetical protein